MSRPRGCDHREFARTLRSLQERPRLPAALILALATAPLLPCPARSRPTVPPTLAAIATPVPTPALLPHGYLSARDSQLVGPGGRPVRIACIGLTGVNVVGGRLELQGPFHGITGHVAAMRWLGFACVRVDWIDQTHFRSAR